MQALSLWFTLLYLVLWVGGVHDTAQLLACINHNPHHSAWSEGGEKKRRKLPQATTIKKRHKT